MCVKEINIRAVINV